MKKLNYIDLGTHKGQEIDVLLNQYKYNKDKYDLHIYAVEANIKLYENLCVKYKDLKNIRIFNSAITNTNGRVNFYLTDHGTLLGSSIFPTKRGVTNDQNYFVNGITFHKFIRDCVTDFDTSINVLKLNIEGAELYVYEDLVRCNLLPKFKLICGHPHHDIEKVSELEPLKEYYYNLMEDNNIKLEYFCAEMRKSNCINIFDFIEK
ncbi:MAG: hypothetical protein H8E98_04460 [Bacteroidetes bacterium]|nr:hypothetical protein [Bacteroidota bacterium]